MDTEWIALDVDGNIALFDTGKRKLKSGDDNLLVFTPLNYQRITC